MSERSVRMTRDEAVAREAARQGARENPLARRSKLRKNRDKDKGDYQPRPTSWIDRAHIHEMWEAGLRKSRKVNR